MHDLNNHRLGFSMIFKAVRGATLEVRGKPGRWLLSVCGQGRQPQRATAGGRASLATKGNFLAGGCLSGLDDCGVLTVNDLASLEATASDSPAGRVRGMLFAVILPVRWHG